MGWIADFSSNAALYFYNYQQPDNHPSFLAALPRPLEAVQYFLAFLGAPLGFGTTQNSLTVATIIGAVLISLMVATCVYIFRFAKDANLVYLTIGWLAIASYTLISALITSIGRVSLGVEQALSSRYTTFSVYLIVAIVHLVAIVLKDLEIKSYGDRRQFLTTQIGTALVTSLLLLHLLTASYGVQQMNLMKQTRLQAKACLLFFNLLKEDCLYKKVFAIPNMAVFPIAKQDRINKKLSDIVNPINDLGFLQPGLVESRNIQDIQGKVKSPDDNYGFFDAIARLEGDVYRASGWAILPDRKEPADAVILTYDTPTGESIVFSLTDIRTERVDVATYLDKKVDSWVGWQKDFVASALPKGESKISAWGFDAIARKAFKLNGTQVIDNEKAGINLQDWLNRVSGDEGDRN